MIEDKDNTRVQNKAKSIDFGILMAASRNGIDRTLRCLFLNAERAEHGILLKVGGRKQAEAVKRKVEALRPDYAPDSIHVDITDTNDIWISDWHTRVGEVMQLLSPEDRRALWDQKENTRERDFRRGYQHGALRGKDADPDKIAQWRFSKQRDKTFPPGSGRDGRKKPDFHGDRDRKNFISGNNIGLILRKRLSED